MLEIILLCGIAEHMTYLTTKCALKQTKHLQQVQEAVSTVLTLWLPDPAVQKGQGCVSDEITMWSLQKAVLTSVWEEGHVSAAKYS